MSDSQTKYQKFFNSALAKFGVKSPAELDDSKKKEFFNYVDDNFKGKNESTEAYGKALQTIAKDRKLKAISKKDRDTLLKIAQMMKKANELREDKEAYQKFFNSALSKFGVKSPAELEDNKKKEFFNYVDDNYKSANEAKNKGLWHNINAKKKRGEKSSPKNSKAYKDAKAAGEKINRQKKNESEDMLRNDKARFETYKMFLEKALKKAGIRVIKFKPMKSGWVRGNTVFGAFFTVKAASGNDTLPFYIDKKGYINLGVSSKDFIVGRLDKFQQVVKNLKDFKKTDLDEVVKEATTKKVTVKEVYKYLKALEEYRYRKVPMVDVRRIASFINNGIKEDELPESLKKKWQFAEYGKEKHLANKFLKARKVNESKINERDEFKTLTPLGYSQIEKVVRYIMPYFKDLQKALKKQDDNEVQDNILSIFEYVLTLHDYLDKNKYRGKYYENKEYNESTVTMDKDQMGKLHNDGEIVLVDPDGKEHKIIYNENTPLQAKMGAYTNVLHALEKFSKILSKAKETKKAKLALQMMKTLQKNFFANESINELKHPRSKAVLDDVKQKVAKLINLASGEHGDKVFDKIKPSAKALRAAEKLLTRVK